MTINPGAVSTLAGSGSNIYADGTGTSASFTNMGGAVFLDGFAYVQTVGAIRKINVTTGAVSTLAGGAPPTGGACDVESSDPALVTFHQTSDLVTDGSYLYSLSLAGPEVFGVCSGTSYRVRRTSIATGATSSVTTGGVAAGSDMAIGPDDMLYVTNGANVSQVDTASGDITTNVLSLPSGQVGFSKIVALTADSSGLWLVVFRDSVEGDTWPKQWWVDHVWINDPGHTDFTVEELTTWEGFHGFVCNCWMDYSAPEVLTSAGRFLYFGGTTVGTLNSSGAGPLGPSVGRIDKYDTNPSPVTIAGGVNSGYQDAGGPAAKFAGIAGVVSGGRSLYVSDSGNHRFRQIVPGKYATDTGGPSLFERLGRNSSECECSYRAEGDPVELSTGNFFEDFTDLAVPSRGPELNLTRTYNSLLATEDGPFGYGWRSTYQMAVRPGPFVNGQTTMEVVQENGTLVAFSWNGSAFVAPGRVFASLALNGDGTYTFTRRNRERFVFDSSGALIRQVGLLGFAGSPSSTVVAAYTTTLSYTAGRLTTVADSAGRTLTFSYGSNGKVSSVEDSAGRTVEYGYNSNGELTDVTDVEDGNTHFGYAPPSGQPIDHLLRTVRDPRGNTVVTNTYDSDGRVTSQAQVVDQTNVSTESSYQTTRTTEFDYTSIAGATKVTDPKGNVMVAAYSDGVLTSETKGYGTSMASTWSYQHDSTTLVTTQTTDPYGAVTVDTADASGNHLTHQDPGGNCQAVPKTGCSTWTYNAFGQVLTFEDPKLTLTTYTRDSATGVLQSVSTPLDTAPGTNQVSSYSYADSDHPGDVTSETDPRGKVWSYTYDAAGNQTSVTDPLNHTAKGCFDAIGRRTKTISPKGTAGGVTCSSSNPAASTTYYTFNAFGDVETTTDPLGHVTTSHYDANGNVDSFTDGNGRVTTYGYDEANEQVTITRADSPSTTLRTEYYADGSLKAQSDANSKVTSYTYDALGRLTSTTDPLHPSVTVDHDQLVSGALTNKTTITDPAGTQTLTYDALGRLTSVDYSGTTPDVTYGYDAASQRTSMTDGTGSSSWTWDSLHRMTSHTNGAGKTVGYTYWLDNQVRTITYASGKVVTRTPDDAGRLDTIQDWLNPNPTSFDYDADSFLTTQTYPNSTTADYTPDNADRLVGVAQQGPSSTHASWSYTRDNANLLSSVNSSGVGTNETYTPTALNQLASVNSATLAYDSADNLTRTTDGTRQQYDAANELCYRSPTTNSPACTAPPSDATRFSYDSRGNRTKMEPPTAVASSFGYDQANRLISAQVPNQSGSDGQYTPTTLTRILDTRDASRLGTCYQPNNTAATCDKVTSSAALTFQVAGFDPDGGGSSPAPVPSSGVAAVALNVTAYSPEATSSLVLFPSDVSKPGTRDLSFNNGQNASNAVIAKLGADGRVTVAVNGTTEVAVDVEGYYTSPSGSTAGGTYTPQVSARIADSRDGASNTGTCDPSPCNNLAASGITTIDVADHGNVPTSGVSAVALTVTALSTTAAGFGVVYPADAGTPSFRQLAFGSDDNVSTTVITKLSGDGKIKIKAITGGFDFLVDVSGWYSTSPDPDESTFVPIVSQRLLDTRTGADIATCSPTCAQLSSGSTTTVQITGLPSGAAVVPSGSTAVVVNLTALNTNGNGYLTSGTTTSNGKRVVSFQSGELASNLVIAKLTTDGKIVIGAESSAADVLVDVQGWYQPATETWTYAYDGDGLRTKKIAPDGTATNFLWDTSGSLPLLIGETTGADTTYYIYDGGGLPLEEVRPDNATVRYYHHDQLGSTRLLTDAGGAKVAGFTYDAYGTLATTTGSATTPLGYAGQYTDAETGFQYLRARYYDPITGNFLTRDPLDAQSRSAYGYAGSAPLDSSDPSGLLRSCRPAGFGSPADGVRSDGVCVLRGVYEAGKQYHELTQCNRLFGFPVCKSEKSPDYAEQFLRATLQMIYKFEKDEGLLESTREIRFRDWCAMGTFEYDPLSDTWKKALLDVGADTAEEFLGSVPGVPAVPGGLKPLSVPGYSDIAGYLWRLRDLRDLPQVPRG